MHTHNEVIVTVDSLGDMWGRTQSLLFHLWKMLSTSSHTAWLLFRGTKPRLEREPQLSGQTARLLLYTNGEYQGAQALSCVKHAPHSYL